MIGTDIIEIDRIAKAVKRPAFFRGVYTEGEREYYHATGCRAETLAGMFCAKEAFAKAVGTGVRGFRLCDIEVCHDGAGAPFIRLYNKAQERFGDWTFALSISHCQTYAMAVCLVLSQNKM